MLCTLKLCNPPRYCVIWCSKRSASGAIPAGVFCGAGVDGGSAPAAEGASTRATIMVARFSMPSLDARARPARVAAQVGGADVLKTDREAPFGAAALAL